LANKKVTMCLVLSKSLWLPRYLKNVADETIQVYAWQFWINCVAETTDYCYRNETDLEPRMRKRLIPTGRAANKKLQLPLPSRLALIYAQITR